MAWRRCRCCGSRRSTGARATPCALRTARADPRPNSPAFADHPALEVIKDAVGLAPVLAVVFAVVAFALAGVVLARRPAGLAARLADRRRAIAVLVLGVLAVAWIGLVAAMTVRGFSGSTRYLMVPAALLIVLGAVGAAWTISAAAPRLTPPAAIVTAVVLAALFVAENSRADRANAARGRVPGGPIPRPRAADRRRGRCRASTQLRPRVHRPVSGPAGGVAAAAAQR